MRINQLTLSCSCDQLRRLSAVSRFLFHDAAATSSFVDIADLIIALLDELPLASIDRVRRSAALLIAGVPKYASVSNYMR